MAVTKVNEKCYLCSHVFKNGDKAWFLGGVELSNMDISTRMPCKPGKLRIKHVIGMKPRAVICCDCLMKIEALKPNVNIL